MNIVFFGSSNFAVPSLKALLTTAHKISCVVTQPDRQKGRHLQLAKTAVKKIAEGASLKIYQPERINTPEAIKFLKDLSPDLFIVVAYGQILSQEILDIPKIFSLNIHGSLLPKYRGAAPINWAIINGEEITGFTIIKMTKEMDAGPVILKKEINIAEGDDALTLEDKLSYLGAQLLLDAIKSIENNNYNLTPQDEEKISFAPRLKKVDGLIHWHKPAKDISNLIRGCAGWPGAFTYYNGKLLKIYRTKVIRLSGDQGISPPGEIMQISKDGIVVATGKDSLMIEELQMEGKRRMKPEEFIAGHRISPGDRLGYP